ncbi:MAG: toll/interleukin-1 receptor domain-containing protein [Limisphaerales bacterium]
MLVSLESLEAYAREYGLRKRAASLYEAKATRQETAFLCHSHKDQERAKGLQVYLEKMGWNVYIDWEDSTMPDTPAGETADRIQKRIKASGWFLFLATPNSTASRWCPWEIGYADGVKQRDAIVIIPTTDRTGAWYGNEYLQLYRRIEVTTTSKLAAFAPGATTGGVLVESMRR